MQERLCAKWLRGLKKKKLELKLHLANQSMCSIREDLKREQ